MIPLGGKYLTMSEDEKRRHPFVASSQVRELLCEFQRGKVTIDYVMDRLEHWIDWTALTQREFIRNHPDYKEP